MKHIFLIIKGFIVGLANIIPGVSGGTMAIIVGVYQKLLDAVDNIFKKFKESFIFLLMIIIGVALSLILGSKAINFALDKAPYIIILFFVGLVIGGIPIIFEKVKGKDNIKPLNIIIMLISISIVLLITLLNPSTPKLDNLHSMDYILLGLMGFIAAFTMIIPGISGSMTLMLFGYYDIVINTVADITNFSSLGHNLAILIPFGIGVIIGLIAAVKIISYLLKRFETKSYFAIFGFIIASIFAIVYNLQDYDFHTSHLIIGIILIPVGIMCSLGLVKLGKKEDSIEEEKTTEN